MGLFGKDLTSLLTCISLSSSESSRSFNSSSSSSSSSPSSESSNSSSSVNKSSSHSKNHSKKNNHSKKVAVSQNHSLTVRSFTQSRVVSPIILLKSGLSRVLRLSTYRCIQRQSGETYALHPPPHRRPPHPHHQVPLYLLCRSRLDTLSVVITQIPILCMSLH